MLSYIWIFVRVPVDPSHKSTEYLLLGGLLDDYQATYARHARITQLVVVE
jgi:hypothetical protein